MGLEIFNSIAFHNKIINKMRKAKIKKILQTVLENMFLQIISVYKLFCKRFVSEGFITCSNLSHNLHNNNVY